MMSEVQESKPGQLFQASTSSHVIDFFGITFRWNWISSVARETTCHGAGRFLATFLATFFLLVV